MACEQKKQRVLGLILARGGSKGIELKNIKLLAGRPLLYWSMHAMRDSGVVDEIWVSTDHDEIERIARAGGAYVHRRSAEVSRDESSSLDTIVEFVKVQQPKCDIIIHNQATFPCIQPFHFREMMEKYYKGGYDSIVTVVRQHLYQWKQVGEGQCTEPIGHDPDNKIRRQDWDGFLFENGANFVTRTKMVAKGIRLGGRVAYYEMPEHLFVDIDTPDDWALAEKRILKYGYRPETTDISEKDQVRLLVCDADGILTDNRVYIAGNDKEMASYNVLDVAAIKKMGQMGIKVLVFSCSEALVHAYIAERTSSELVPSCVDKLARVEESKKGLGLEWDQVAFIGADVLDRKCLLQAGVVIVPSDADPEVKQYAKYVAPSAAGNGVISDAFKYLVERCYVPYTN
jgi:N-acylneuraminate cytidylyltransferase